MHVVKVARQIVFRYHRFKFMSGFEILNLIIKITFYGLEFVLLAQYFKRVYMESGKR